MPKITLSAYELSLLEKAREFAQQTVKEENRYPSRDMFLKHLGCGSQVARNIQLYLMDFFELDEPEEEPVKETQSFKGDIWEISIPKTDIHTEVQLVDYMQIDLQKWEIIECTFNKWSMGTAGGGKQSLFQVKARCKLRRNIVDAKNEIAALREEAKNTVRPVVYPMDREPVDSGLVLEIAIFDLHFGKQSWSQETLDRPYDVKITEVMFFRALERIIERSKGFKYEKVLFIVGNDLLHSNDLDSKTANGTIVDSDGRFQKAYVTARKAMVAAIERLRSIAPVHVLVCVGNHDRFSAWTLGDSLESWFHNDPDVVIDNGPALRKYFQWGDVGLLFTHGDEGKRQDFPLLFATERSEMFGQTKFREVHTGHNHTTKTEEFHGVRVRIISSLSTADSWHASKGFKGALRTAEAFVWSKTEGLIAQYTYSDDAFPAIITKRELV
jgi:hypothetical protein